MNMSVLTLCILLLILIPTLSGCSTPDAAIDEPIDEPVITRNADGSLAFSGDFISGVDLSSVISVENSGVTFYNPAGEAEDIFAIFKDAGVNYVRVRVWNDPFLASAATVEAKTPENSYGGGVCDINYAVQIAKRCEAVGLSLYVDFHYSDFWSDPARSYVPKAWKGMNSDEKAAAIYDFTTESLNKIAETGVHIGIVSIGNETNNWMAGEAGIRNIAPLMKSGCEAVRAFDKNIMVALHFTNPESHNYVSEYASVLEAAAVDYDIFASSYYPMWHGTLDNLKSQLEAVTNKYGKLTMIAEYSYNHTGENNDSQLKETFGDYSEDGQLNAIRIIGQTAAETKNCIGTFYWEPAWLKTAEKYWSTEGSGWISANAAEYDIANMNITKAQGSACFEGAVFDANGTPLKAIIEKAFQR